MGWDGVVVPGSWNPVRVKVTGGDADATARVEMVLKTRFQPNPQTPAVDFPVGAYGEEVALPARVAKEVTLWVPSDNSYGGPGILIGAVRLTVGGRVLAEQKIDSPRGSRASSWPLIGVLADSPSVARSISQVELPVQGLTVPLGVAKLAAANLPAIAERLNAMSALVVQGNAAATLTGEQRRAVQEWVASGGHLLLAGGSDAARSLAVLPSGSLPVTYEATDGSADLSSLARWTSAREALSGPGPVARFRAASGSLLAGTSDHPLAWRLTMGLGTVTLLAFDPALEPLSSWAGTPGLLKKAMEPALPSPDENEKMRYIRQQERDVPLRLQGSIEAMPVGAFPSWWTVALVLGGFALVVGPLAHLLLWRADRRGWIWVVVPVSALLLSGTLYYLGVGRGGRDVLTNVVSYIELNPETGRARESLLAGFFAPTYSQLTVEVPGDTPVRVMSRFGGPYGPTGEPTAPAAEPPFHVVAGRSTRVEFDSGQWAMRSIALTRDLGQEAGRITSRLGLEEGLIKGTLRNDTRYLLEDAAVLVGQSLVKLGSLAPGQTAQVVLDPGPSMNPFEGGFPLSYRLFGRPAGADGAGGSGGISSVAMPVPAGVSMASIRSGMPERYELPPDPEIQRRVRLMDPIVNGPRFGPGAPAIPLTFIAFTQAEVSGALPSAGDHPVFHLALLKQTLRLDLPVGPFTLPPAMTFPEQQDQTGGMGGGGNGTISWMQIMGGSVTYGLRPPLPARARVQALTLTTRQMGQATAWGSGKPTQPPGPNLTPGPAEAGVFSVYNWETASWEPLPGGQEQARLEPAVPYLGAEGVIKLQVSSGTDRMVQFLLPELTVEGRVVE